MEMVSLQSEVEPHNAPLCSVCIANYNGELFIEQCIDSVLKQEKFPGSIEIIVHDDASTDNSINLITERYPQVRLLESETNVGFCVSNNRMVAVAQGEYILLLNNDAKLHSDALKTLYDESVKHGVGIYGLPQYDAANGGLIDIGGVFDLFLNPIPNNDIFRNQVGMIIGACLWLSKNLWQILGGFPEWFETLAEDVYICCLARLWGYPVTAIPKSGFDHWVGRSIGGGKVLEDNTLSTTFSRRFLSERNKTYVLITCYPAPVVCLLVPLHLLVLSLEGICLSLVKRDINIWRKIYCLALQETWKNRGRIMSVRAYNQSLKAISIWAFFRPFSFIPHKLRMLLKHGLPQLKQQ